MDVRESDLKDASTRAPDQDRAALRPPSRQRVGEALGEWQASEVTAAWRYPQCRGLSRAQLEDLYQETVLALLNRPFVSEEHLRNALRLGLRHRALHVHRDERRRSQILAEHAPEAHRDALRRSERQQPEQATLAHEDGLIVLEFASGLSPLEQQIYALEAEGLRYRAIAPMIGVSAPKARKASRELQAKYARFQLLHDTGRLCGYRAPTIRALLAGEETDEQLARAAFAHLRSCAQCRSEHRTNSARLRQSFQERAAALLPIPALAGHGTLEAVWLRIRLTAHRVLAGGAPPGSGGVRERAVAVLAGGGATAKLAAGVATVAAVAGSTLGAVGVTHTAGLRRHHASSHRVRVTASSYVAPATVAPTAQAVSDGRPSSAGSEPSTAASPKRREPGGFAFLGVPGGSQSRQARASVASAGEGESTANAAGAAPNSKPPSRASSPPNDGQHGGGPFAP